jgi:hypothetical protein
MEAELDYTKSAQDNANSYFEESKDAKRKIEGAEQAIKKLELKVKQLEKEKEVSKELKKTEEREWYEKFYWFFASNGMLAIGGRSAQQNEMVNTKYFDADDLFFHANIFGASAVVLKNGVNASKEVKEEAAQFAACFSSAWENGQSSVDVFSSGRENVSKSGSKGYLATGSFLISGEREWYRNVKLELYAFMAENRIKLQNKTEQDNALISTTSLSIIVNASKFNVVPSLTYSRAGTVKGARLSLGKLKKSDAAKALMKKLGYKDIDYVMQHLPPGEFSIE